MDFTPYPPLVKVIFMINRKGLLKGFQNLNDLDLKNDLNDLIP